MLPFQSILCPTDFSDPSYEALDRAVEMAAHFKAELCLVHVTQPIPPLLPTTEFVAFDVVEYEQALRADAEQKLAELVEQRVTPEVTSRFVVKRGDAAEQIVCAAREEGADLIVIATHGLTGWRHFVFGSVAEKVVQLSPCPVLTIHAPHEGQK